MVVPIRGQYEQQCNAAALQEMQVTVLKTINDQFLAEIHRWLEQTTIPPMIKPVSKEVIIDAVIERGMAIA